MSAQNDNMGNAGESNARASEMGVNGPSTGWIGARASDGKARSSVWDDPRAQSGRWRGVTGPVRSRKSARGEERASNVCTAAVNARHIRIR